MYWATTEILIVGAWLEAEFGLSMFARSGAVITLLAICILWLYLKYEEENRDTAEIIELIRRSFKNAKAVEYEFYDQISRNKIPDLPESTRSRLVMYALKMMTEGVKAQDRIAKISRSLVYLQIEIAALGTFIWAFGDLIILSVMAV